MTPLALTACLFGADPITIEPSDTAAAVVIYENVAPPASHPGSCTLALDGLQVVASLAVGATEILTITPPAGYVAVPPKVEVQDGDTARVSIEWVAF